MSAPRGSDEPAALPAALASLVEGVVKRTKLWRRERADVRRELVTHFADGLESGASASELQESFGDPKSAAKLIRRSKKRNRPLWWRATAGTIKAGAKAAGAVLALLFVGYAVMFVLYNTGKPNVTRNYVAEMRAEVDAIPMEDRAWPVYLRAIRLLDGEAWARADHEWVVAPTRDEAAAWLNAHAEGIATVRAAAAKPALGYKFSHRVDPELEMANGRSVEEEPIADDDPLNGVVVGVLLPYLRELKQMAQTLWIDARVAISGGDGDRFVSDVDAILGIADQVRAGGFLIGDLVSISLVSLASRTIDEALVESASALDDDALRRVAHRLNAYPSDGGPIIRLSGERTFFEDFLQRVYTDDSKGGGLPTAEGWRLASQLSSDPALPQPTIGERMLGPVTVLTFADRRAMREEYERLINLALAEHATPMWERGASRIDAELAAMRADPLKRMRFQIVHSMAPSLGAALQQADKLAARRSATNGAIAAELFRRRSGAWPDSWDDLAPDLIPAAPIDPFTGRPMGLRIVDDVPRIYSVGQDLDDDAGAWVFDDDGEVVNHRAGDWLPREEVERLRAESSHEMFDGDWVLFPPPPREPIAAPIEAEALPSSQ